MNKTYDLEERTTNFAKETISLCKEVPINVVNKSIVSQLIRSSGSVGANYREANEAISKKDFLYRIRIARKECKEAGYWLDLLNTSTNSLHHKLISRLINESKEIRNILSTILMKFI